MGSHSNYCKRYPPSFAKFGGRNLDGNGSPSNGRSRKIDCYDNSVAFTDFVLSRIYAEAKQLPGFRAFVYLSDHADDVEAGLLALTSAVHFQNDAYSIADLALRQVHGEPAGARQDAAPITRTRVWTNDLLDDLLVGLTGVSVEAYDPKYDLSSSSYQLDWSTALTLHGRRWVIDDPDLAPVAFGADAEWGYLRLLGAQCREASQLVTELPTTREADARRTRARRDTQSKTRAAAKGSDPLLLSHLDVDENARVSFEEDVKRGILRGPISI